MNEYIDLEIFWTFRNRYRCWPFRSRIDAEQSVSDNVELGDDPKNWGIENCFERLAVVEGRVHQGEGEVITLGEEGGVVDCRPSLPPTKVFYQCPLCHEQHCFDLFRSFIDHEAPLTSPELCRCENGEDAVLVRWSDR